MYKWDVTLPFYGAMVTIVKMPDINNGAPFCSLSKRM